MTRAAKTAFAVLAAAAVLLAAGCATDLGGARVSARLGTRIPGQIVQNGDGTAYQIDRIDPPGNTIFFIVRGRY
jgi:hypothetical protein